METDHHPLVYLQTQASLSRKQPRWLEFLQQFAFRVQYVKGRDNVVADALSRKPVQKPAQQPRETDQELQAIATGTMSQNARIDEEVLQLCLSQASTGQTSSRSQRMSINQASIVQPPQAFVEEMKAALEHDDLAQQVFAPLTTISEPWTQQDGLLYYNQKLYIPAEGTGRKTLIQEAHTSLSAGHPGI